MHDDSKLGRSEARELLAFARCATSEGDYRRARQLLLLARARVGVMGCDVGQGAEKELSNLNIDPLALQVGIAASIVYVLGWVVVIWG